MGFNEIVSAWITATEGIYCPNMSSCKIHLRNCPKLPKYSNLGIGDWIQSKNHIQYERSEISVEHSVLRLVAATVFADKKDNLPTVYNLGFDCALTFWSVEKAR